MRNRDRSVVEPGTRRGFVFVVLGWPFSIDRPLLADENGHVQPSFKTMLA
jgi:hypothetical protein